MSQLLKHRPLMACPSHMTNQIEQHSAWFHSVGINDAEKLLLGKNSFTYFFRSENLEPNQYILSFLDKDNLVQHQRIRIRFSDRIGWYFQNCTTELRTNVLDLIPFMMRCTPEQCSAVQ